MLLVENMYADFLLQTHAPTYLGGAVASLDGTLSPSYVIFETLCKEEEAVVVVDKVCCWVLLEGFNFETPGRKPALLLLSAALLTSV